MKIIGRRLKQSVLSLGKSCSSFKTELTFAGMAPSISVICGGPVGRLRHHF